MLISEARVETQKASRYLKALCNHFSRKVTAEYTDDRGTVQFSIGRCEMRSEPEHLILRVEAEDAERLAGVKSVVADHLVRFAPNESLQVNWVDQVTEVSP